MTAAEKSRPAQLADEIEALGWKVERVKEGARRTVIARRGDETIRFDFERRETTGAVKGVKDVFAGGQHWVGDSFVEVPNVAAALAEIRAMPFALDAPDDVVLAALAGKTVKWVSRITGTTQTGAVPRGGVHLKLTSGMAPSGPIAPEDRVLHFTDPLGFHAVRIGAIVEVK